LPEVGPLISYDKTPMNETSPERTVPIHRRFPPVGQCIYCGDRDQLSGEHIIAYSLNGTATLPRASCPKCATITSRFELTFARGPAHAMRAAFGFKSRKGEYPASFPLLMVIRGVRQEIHVPLAEFPLILQLPLFEPLPAFLRGQRGVPITSKETVLVSLRENTSPTVLLQEIGRRYRAEGIEVPRVDHKSFARLIAKSAYALAVAEFGITNIREKFVVPAILGEADDLGTWVGSSRPLAGEQAEHITQIKTFTTPAGESVIVVLMKLFAALPAPGYVIVAASKV